MNQTQFNVGDSVRVPSIFPFRRKDDVCKIVKVRENGKYDLSYHCGAWHPKNVDATLIIPANQ